MYNVATGLFLGSSPTSTDNAIVSLDGNDMYLEQTGDNWYLRRYSADGYYLCELYSNQAYYVSSTSPSFMTWITTATSESYTFKSVRNKDNALYLGVGDANKVYGDKTENINWQFMAADKAAHYAAEMKLYNALKAADGKGWAIDSYETMYNNRATATNLQLTQAADQLVQAVEYSAHTGVFDPLNNYNMMFYMNALNGYDRHGYLRESKFYDNYVHFWAEENNSATFTAIVETTADAELFYTPKSYYNDYCTMKVYVDNVLVRTIEPYVLNALNYNEDRFFEPLSVGKHIVTWEIVNADSKSSQYVDISRIGVVNIKPIEVHLAEPGSLGTEILYNVDHVNDVRNLKIVGDMNAEDAVRLSMLTNALNIDMSEATISELPAETFSYSHTPYLHTIVLPEGLKTIGNRCFFASNITSVNIPSTVTTIESNSFAYTNISAISMPDAVTSLGSNAFEGCFMLKDVRYSAGLTTVPYYAFNKCLSLNTCNLPEGITLIDRYAFNECKYGTFNPILPSTLKEIREYAFSDCDGMTNIVIPDAVEEIGNYCFTNCDKLTHATMSQNIYAINSGWGGYFNGCSSLVSLTLRSATVIDVKDKQFIDDSYRSNITLRVPKYLVNSYKLDPYWYNFGAVEGFSTADTKDWTIHADLTLDSHSRFEGEPNIKLKKSNFRIVGDLPMTIDNFTTNCQWYSFDYYGGTMSMDWSSQVMSKCDNISVSGNCYHNATFTGQRWLCMSLPFDTKLGNIKSMSDDVLYAVRVYDGAKRATSGAGANWRRITDDNYEIPAGTGFIIQTSAGRYDYSTVQFKSLENESRNNIVRDNEFTKSLAINACADKANMGWNLVGNPYMTYYNIHKLNFTAPITIYDSNKAQYFAYSITDDDYALMPTQGFFVQCPGTEMQTISFPVSGKQFTDEITEQNAAKGSRAADNKRQIIDLTLSNGENSDKTRVVMNDAASTAYEVSCDASKFMSDNKEAVQLWTIDDNGTQYAINERPMADGIVTLGVSLPTNGTYTFEMPRCLAEGIVLYDNETGVETDLTTSNYTFSANAGIDTKRFVLRSKSSNATGIVSHAGNLDKVVTDIYTMDGRFVMKTNGNFNVESLPQGMYVVRKNGETQKVVIK